MNTTDVMIGDWVLHNDKPKQVCTIWSNQVSLTDPQEVYGSIYTDKYPIEEIEPIPLTREIVLKNFEVSEHVMRVEKEKFKIDNPEWLHLIYENKYDDWILTWQLSTRHPDSGFTLFIYDCPMPEMHYVHELQHFLKLCDIKEEVKL